MSDLICFQAEIDNVEGVHKLLPNMVVGLGRFCDNLFEYIIQDIPMV